MNYQKHHLPDGFNPAHPLYKMASFRNRYNRALQEEGGACGETPVQAQIEAATGLMRCSRVGINVTKRCNWRCQTCFYRYAHDFNAMYDVPLDAAMAEACSGQARGCDHAVLIGWGEPGLWKHLPEFIRECGKIGMTTSIITNGSLSVERYRELYNAGLNHLHVSVHGIGKVLDEISGVEGAGARQDRVIRWLGETVYPWRMNMTVQRANYKTLPDIAEYCIKNGCRHIISLGFLPHYEWNDPAYLRQVAVHPAELREYIEQVGERVEQANTLGGDIMFTIRYHPMCHLGERWRKYVVNAAYVLYDPWEWDYGHRGELEHIFWRSALQMGGSVSIDRIPCIDCGARVHCGGWNRVYCNGFGHPQDILAAIDMPPNTFARGWLHLQNPANSGKGWF